MLCKHMDVSGPFRNGSQIGILGGKYDIYLIRFTEFIGFDRQPDRIRPVEIYFRANFKKMQKDSYAPDCAIGPISKKGFRMMNLSILILNHPLP